MFVDPKAFLFYLWHSFLIKRMSHEYFGLFNQAIVFCKASGFLREIGYFATYCVFKCHRGELAPMEKDEKKMQSGFLE